MQEPKRLAHWVLRTSTMPQVSRFLEEYLTDHGEEALEEFLPVMRAAYDQRRSLNLAQLQKMDAAAEEAEKSRLAACGDWATALARLDVFVELGDS